VSTLLPLCNYIFCLWSWLTISRKKFAFYEGENLICCPVLFTMALALADNAFENKFTSLAQIYNLIVPSDTDRIRLKWDGDWARRPVFRDIEDTSDGIRMSQTKGLQYAKHRHHFVRLGRSCGYRKRLQFYDLRRASGKRLKGENELLPSIAVLLGSFTNNM